MLVMLLHRRDFPRAFCSVYPRAWVVRERKVVVLEEDEVLDG